MTAFFTERSYPLDLLRNASSCFSNISWHCYCDSHLPSALVGHVGLLQRAETASMAMWPFPFHTCQLSCTLLCSCAALIPLLRRAVLVLVASSLTSPLVSGILASIPVTALMLAIGLSSSASHNYFIAAFLEGTSLRLLSAILLHCTSENK
ncbi:hypothetical protein ISCGN_025044 [Ixodes scapularis]